MSQSDPHLDAVRSALAGTPVDPARQQAMDSILQMGAEGSYALGGEGVAGPSSGQGPVASDPAPRAQRPVAQGAPKGARKGNPEEDPWAGLLNKITWKEPSAFATPSANQIPVMSVLSKEQYAKLNEIAKQEGLAQVPYVFDTSQLDEKQLATMMKLRAARQQEHAAAIEAELAAKEKRNGR